MTTEHDGSSRSLQKCSLSLCVSRLSCTLVFWSTGTLHWDSKLVPNIDIGIKVRRLASHPYSTAEAPAPPLLCWYYNSPFCREVCCRRELCISSSCLYQAVALSYLFCRLWKCQGPGSTPSWTFHFYATGYKNWTLYVEWRQTQNIFTETHNQWFLFFVAIRSGTAYRHLYSLLRVWRML